MSSMFENAACSGSKMSLTQGFGVHLKFFIVKLKKGEREKKPYLYIHINV